MLQREKSHTRYNTRQPSQMHVFDSFVLETNNNNHNNVMCNHFHSIHPNVQCISFGSHIYFICVYISCFYAMRKHFFIVFNFQFLINLMTLQWQANRQMTSTHQIHIFTPQESGILCLRFGWFCFYSIANFVDFHGLSYFNHKSVNRQSHLKWFVYFVFRRFVSLLFFFIYIE